MGSVVVLDLDETLLHAISAQDCEFKGSKQEWKLRCHEVADKITKRTNKIRCLVSKSYLIVVRPNAISFLQECRDKFECMIIFTAATASHASFVRSELFDKLAQVEPDFMFDRSECGLYGEDVDLHQDRVKTALNEYQKNLCRIREYVNKSRRFEKLNWDDCLFIDDSWQHSTTNCAESLIVPKFDFPCLKNWCATGKVDSKNLLEVRADDFLRRAGFFILAKVQLKEPRWSQVDKRFALFVPNNDEISHAHSGNGKQKENSNAN